MTEDHGVLILVENLSVPFDQRVWREATALRDAGYCVSVICPAGRELDRSMRENVDGVAIYRYPGFEARRGLFAYGLEFAWALIAMTVRSFEVFLRQGFRVIQLCNPPDLLFLVALPYRFLGRRIIFDHHDLAPETYCSRPGQGASRWVRRILLLMERVTFRCADVVMATNQSYRRIALERGRVPEDDIFVVRNGPDLARIRKVPANPALRKGRPHLLLYVGTMGPQDGVDYFLRSLDHLLHTRERDDWHAMIVGGGIQLETLKRYARELDLEDRVTFTGRVPDEALLEALSTADVCVCPDPKNPLNDVSTMNKTMEYMAVGKPVVAFDLVETRASAADAALYAPGNDYRAFGDSIAHLLDNPSLRATLGARGLARIRQSLSWQHSKRPLYSAYERAFAKAGRSCPDVEYDADGVSVRTKEESCLH
ncbi:MAG: glycosyltransferase family 4 protein [Candidatus Hydrogenedentes bacterium]|nr:glycosyltransferase family 4 protein [Candidatus Hydrogenedentota bacterium]